jgi:hypothetical protein
MARKRGWYFWDGDAWTARLRRPPWPIRAVRAAYDAVAGGAIVTGWIAPLVAGFTTSAIYFGCQSLPGWSRYAVEWGIVAGVVAWALAAIVLWPVVATRRADSESWYLASERLRQLSVRLHHLDATSSGHQPGVDEARRAVASVCNARFLRPGVHWATHLGYIALWRALHVGEAALILSMSRDDLWQTLQWVRLRLDGASAEVSGRLKAVVDDVAGYLAANPAPDCQQNGAGQPAPRCPPTDLGLPAVTSEGDARRRLRQVVAALNDFVDEKYAGLVRIRNHILAALGLTELFAFVLLALAVGWLPTGSVATCLLYFVVAAVAGFIGRLISLASRTDPASDYGLERARLLIVPVVSGLAGLGGVVLTALLASTSFTSLITVNAGRASPGGSLPSLLDVVSLTANPAGILFAIVFGYAPTLLQARLDSLVESYKSAIKSTEPAQDRVITPSGGGPA